MKSTNMTVKTSNTTMFIVSVPVIYWFANSCWHHSKQCGTSYTTHWHSWYAAIVRQPIRLLYRQIIRYSSVYIPCHPPINPPIQPANQLKQTTQTLC